MVITTKTYVILLLFILVISVVIYFRNEHYQKYDVPLELNIGKILNKTIISESTVTAKDRIYIGNRYLTKPDIIALKSMPLVYPDKLCLPYGGENCVKVKDFKNLKNYFNYGTVIAFSGYEKDIPDNWSVCDGTNGTPNLTDRFIVGAGDIYGLSKQGGEKEHILTIDEMPSHSHSMQVPSKDNRLDNTRPVNIGDVRYGRHGNHMGTKGKGIGACSNSPNKSLRDVTESYDNVDTLINEEPNLYIPGISLEDCVKNIQAIPALKGFDTSIRSVMFRLMDDGPCKNTCSYFFETDYWSPSNTTQPRNTWMMSVLYRNSKGESFSVDENIFPKFTKKNIQPGNGYYIGPSSNACSECVVSNKENDLLCPFSSKQLGSLYADIYGCGIEKCDARYGLSTIEQCNDKCFLNKDCKSFSWSPVGGDKVFPDKNVCTLYNNTIFSKGTNRQIMCQPQGLADINISDKDKKFMNENKQCYSHITSVRQIFENSSTPDSNTKKQNYIKELNLTPGEKPTYKQLFDYFKENEGSPCMNSDSAQKKPHNNMPPYYRVIFIMRTLVKKQLTTEKQMNEPILTTCQILRKQIIDAGRVPNYNCK